MFKKSISLIMTACLVLSTVTTGFAQQSTELNNKSARNIKINETKPWKKGQLIVKYKNNSSIRANANVKNDEKVLKSDSNGLTLIEVPEDKVTDKIEVLKKDGNVEYVVPNYIRKTMGFPADIPNDPQFKDQWGLKNISAQDAWINIGDTGTLSEIKVAVIDTGVDLLHEDLKDAFIEGYDFVEKDKDPTYGPVNEEHASHVSGIIAASTDNGLGVAGSIGKAPVKIMPLRVLEAGYGDDFTIAEAITYAADNGAKVINMSLGGAMESPALTEAVEYALSKNVVVVAAAGNSGSDAANFYPAAIPGVISVSATDVNNELASFSNYGGVVELGAPGVEVLSTIPGNKYEYYEGTSMAAPFVSAACALMLSKNPSLSNIEVEHILTDSAKDIGKPGKDESFGFGLLDINAGLKVTEIKPRLEIMNLFNNTTVYDILNIQTRFTYPLNIVKTELYVDDNIVETISESSGMFNNFELDTYNYRDGEHIVKVQAYDKEEKTYTKEVKINVRNTVYTGLRVKLTHDGNPVSGGNIQVWNKYTGSDGKTYYDYVHDAATSKNGTAIIPGSSAPNGNTYVIVANYGFAKGEDFSNAALIKEVVAPNIVEIDGKDLIPVTVNTGLKGEGQAVFATYKFPGSEESFQFFIPSDISGDFKAYLNPGTYSFEAFTYNDPTLETVEPLYFLTKPNVLIGKDNNVVNMESDVDKLSKVKMSYSNIHGFIPSDTFVSLSSKDSMLGKGFSFDDIKKAPEVYFTPGTYSISYDIMGAKGNDKAYISLQGSDICLQQGEEKEVTLGGIFTGKIKTDKTNYIPGEAVNVDAAVTDSQGNRLLYMEYIQENPFLELMDEKTVFYKRGNTKVGLRLTNNIFEEPLEPIEIEYKSPATIQLIDSKNNVLMDVSQNSMEYVYFEMGQNILAGNYKLKMIVDLPYLIQSQTDISVAREAKKDAVKFTVELPGKEKALMADMQAVNVSTGETFYQWGQELLNGEMFASLPKGKYKIALLSSTSDQKQVMYVKEIQSPGSYKLAPSQLQNVKLSVKDEDGNIITGTAIHRFTSAGTNSFNFSVPGGENSGDCYISKGKYNISTEVYNEEYGLPERIIFKENVSIGTNNNKPQSVEFTSDNLTEVKLGEKSDAKLAIAMLTEPKTGLNTVIILQPDVSVKISKGFYNLEMLCEKLQYGNAYAYFLTSQKDFSKDNTYIECGTEFSMSVTPNKALYKKNEIMKSEHSISDRFGNKVSRVLSFGFFVLMKDTLKGSNGNRIISEKNGKYQIIDMKKKEVIEVPYDIRAPFVYIKNANGEVVYTSKSATYYTNSEIKLDSVWAKSGAYKIQLAIDINADGDLWAEAPFTVK